MFAAECDGGQHIFGIARRHDANGDLAIVGGVCSVKSAATGVETDFSAKVTTEGGFESENVDGFGSSGQRAGGKVKAGGGIGHWLVNIFGDAGQRTQGYCNKTGTAFGASFRQARPGKPRVG